MNDILWVRVLFDTEDEREYAIIGRMPVTEFREHIERRYPHAKVKKVEFLHEPSVKPSVAEVLL